MKKYTLYSDPGHGWLKVSRKECASLGILKQITHYSFQSKTGKTLYLEEDQDAGLFFHAKQLFKEKEFKVHEEYRDPCHVRRLPSFKLKT